MVQEIVERLFAWLLSLDRRVMVIGGGALVFLILFQAWILLFRAPIAAYRATEAEIKELKKAGELSRALPQEVSALKVQIAALGTKTRGKADGLNADQMVVHILRTLDSMSAKSRIALVGVKPGTSRAISGFDELNFEVTATGSYADFYDWLGEVERELYPMVITKLALTPTANPKQLSLAMGLATYRGRQVEEKK
jgi:Tfp pilus assembly protein PilO